MEKLIDDELIREYVRNGGNLFRVTTVDSIRDGGTGIIITSMGNFYADKDTKKIHNGYPLTNENIVTDKLLIFYLIDRIEGYVTKSEGQLIRDKSLLRRIVKNEIKSE